MRIDSKVSDVDGLGLELLDFGKLILPDSIHRWISSRTKRGKREGRGRFTPSNEGSFGIVPAELLTIRTFCGPNVSTKSCHA